MKKGPDTLYQRTQVRALRGLGPLNSDRDARSIVENPGV
jgi:hypothetical protein